MATEDLSEEEAYLWAIFNDPSGIDLAEFTWTDWESEDLCWRAWSFQWAWWHCVDPLQIDHCSRSCGKSMSVMARAFSFPFRFPGNEMVITAPEGVHVDAITDKIETQFRNTRLGLNVLRGGRQGFKHKPFQATFINGARILGRIPHRDGSGIKGCVGKDSVLLAQRGFLFADEVEVGDLILSASDRWVSVQEVQCFEDETVRVDAVGVHHLDVSPLHRFYGAYNLASVKQRRTLGELEWAETSELDNFYLASPLNFPQIDVPSLNWGRSLTRFEMSPDFWWIVGLFIADGYTSVAGKRNKDGSYSSRRVHFMIHPTKQEELKARLKSLGLHCYVKSRKHSSADDLSVASVPLARWLDEHIGKGAEHKQLPPCVLGLPVEDREQLLAGYLYGDGHFSEERQRFTAGTASKRLAIGLKMLAISLGYSVGLGGVQPSTSSINGVPLKAAPKYSWRLMIGKNPPLLSDGKYFGRVNSVEPSPTQAVYNFISEDHSYVADGVYCHNTHPIQLELDEAQDYPPAGWVEITETLKRGHAGATWRAHGVTRGVRDYFYKHTSGHTGWTVHRYSAQWRPTWSDEERQEKIEQYGGRDDPDYRRNVLGEHGDEVSPLFVLHRLMRCVDDNYESNYNNDEYVFLRINDAYLKERGMESILEAIDLPLIHTEMYKTFWCGMDVGYTNHPSEILVFAEYVPKAEEIRSQKGKAIPSDEQSRLKLLARIQLKGISAPDQYEVLKFVIRHYKPQAFAMDRTGNGLPLFQFLEEEDDSSIADVMRGYNFSEKLLVDFDHTIEVDERLTKEELAKETGIKRNAPDYATDILRLLVDSKRLWLPWDKDLIAEFEGQTYKITKTTMDQYGRREYSTGKFHALDAARMGALAWKQHSLEEFMKKDEQEAVPVFFIGD